MRSVERPSLIINPAGGNEPVILGSLLASEIDSQITSETPDKSGCRAIIPVTGNQAAILADEFRGNKKVLESTLLDPTAGEIPSPLLATQGDFATHLSALRSRKPQIDLDISRHYSSLSPLELHDLSGNPITVDTKSIFGVLDTGGRAEVRPELPRHFAFPVLFSEIARQAIIDELPYDTSDLVATKKEMAAMEARYTTIYLPLINTLASAALQGTGPNTPVRELFDRLLDQPKTDKTTLTPPLKKPMHPGEASSIPREAVFAMLSGTGSAIDEVRAATISLAQEGELDVYTNPWSRDIAGIKKLSPKDLTDPRILAVVSRSGWGTGWQMLNMAKPWLLVPEQAGDDPEIHYNNELITSLGIGEVVDPRHFNATDIIGAVAKYTRRMQEFRTLTEAHFEIPGPTFVGKDIAYYYLQTGRI